MDETNITESHNSCATILASPTRNVHLQALLALVALALLVALTGCTPLGSTTRPRTVPTATPTPLPRLVTVAVTAVPHGTIAAQNSDLLATVTITNHTDAPIFITSIGCSHPTLLIELRNASGAMLWSNEDTYVNCPIFATKPSDTWLVGANASLVRQVTATFFTPWPSLLWIPPANPASLRTDVPYTFVASVRQWHQGKLSEIGNPAVPQGKDVFGEVQITFS